MVPEWVYGTAAALAVVHLVRAYLLYATDRLPASAAAETRADESCEDELREDESRPADAVECRECGADNESGYRFCRACASRLPASGRGFRAGEASGTRRLT